MSEEQLAPTLDNFDAIVARNSAKAEAMENGDASDTESPDADERDTSPGGFDAPEDEQADEEHEEAEQAEEPDEEDEGDNTETEQVEAKLRAPFKALREALSTKRMTPQLMEALGDVEMELDLPGGKTVVPVRDLANGYMRTARLHRELEKTRNDQQRAQHIVEIEQARTNSWRQDDMEWERGNEIMGCRQSMERWFWREAQRKHVWMNATPEQRAELQRMQHQNQMAAQERARFMEMERKLKHYESQPSPQQDANTQHAERFIQQNMDKALTAAFKTANAGKVSDLVREQFLDELTAMAKHGMPLDKALSEAAELVADRFAERRELARAEHREQEQRTRPKEASPRRAPPAAPQKRDAVSGQYKSNGKGRKEAPTAANFARRFGL